MPRLSAIGFAPAATLRRPSRTSAWASTVAVVVPSPAMSSVFLATSLTSSAPIFSHGSSSSISLAIDTPSLVMVGAPHFFSRTTLRPRGPERHLDGVGEDVHAALEPAARLLVESDHLRHEVLSSRFAESTGACGAVVRSAAWGWCWSAEVPATDEPQGPRPIGGPDLADSHRTDLALGVPSANSGLALRQGECKASSDAPPADRPPRTGRSDHRRHAPAEQKGRSAG